MSMRECRVASDAKNTIETEALRRLCNATGSIVGRLRGCRCKGLSPSSAAVDRRRVCLFAGTWKENPSLTLYGGGWAHHLWRKVLKVQ